MSRHLQVSLTCCSLLLVLQLSSCANDCKKQNSYLWRIETTPPIYLFGTMHVPYNKMWQKIPNNVKAVFSNASNLGLELQLSDSNTLKDLAHCRYLPKGVYVNEVLPQDLYLRIVRYLLNIQTLFPSWLAGKSGTVNGFVKIQSNQLFSAMISNWKRQRPIWLLLLLSSLSRETVQNRMTPLLDVFLDNAAQGMGKDVKPLENFKEHCRPFNKLNDTQVIVALTKQLDYLESLPDGPISNTDSDIATYQCGDFLSLIQCTSILPLPNHSKLQNLTSWEAQILTDINTSLEKQVIFRRNRRITNKVRTLLKQKRNTTYMFALGAGHLLGKKSIIHRLQKRGYTVTLIPATQDIEGPSLPSNIIALGDPLSVPKILVIPGTVDTPTTVPPTMPTLSPSTISKIVQKVLNKTNKNITKYRVDSVEVSPSPSPSPQPNSEGNQLIPVKTSTRGITIATNIERVDQNQRTASSSVRWSSQLNILIITLLIVFSFLF